MISPDGMSDQAHIKRERAKARELRESQWWKNQIGPGLCHHCGQKFPKSQLTMDHLTPLARGGKTTKANVVPSCKACNQTRGHKLDVERALEDMAAGLEGETEDLEQVGLWLLPEHSAALGQSPVGVNCFVVSHFYFNAGDQEVAGERAMASQASMTADEVLDWVASQFMQIDSPSEYDEPVLVLVWSKSESHEATKPPVEASPKTWLAPPNVLELAKRAAGFPFDWVLEHTTVLIEPARDQENVRVFEKASPREEDPIVVRGLDEALKSYATKPGFALSFHVPV